MQNIQGSVNDTVTDTVNTNCVSIIDTTSRRSEGLELNQNNWHGFQTNEFFSFQEVEMLK